MVNESFYTICPRSLVHDSPGVEWLVSLYGECREMKHYPYPGGPAKQTAFLIDVLGFLDSQVQKFQNKEQERHQKQMKTDADKARSANPSRGVKPIGRANPKASFR
jgi:hypothetical protein